MNIRQFKLKMLPIAVIFLISTGLVISACSSDDTTGSQDVQVTEVRISPDDVSFEAGEQYQFSVVALTANGEEVDTDKIDIDWDWWSTDPDIFTVEPGGLATGHNPGEAFCMVEATVGVTQSISDRPDIKIASLQLNVHQGNSDQKPAKTMTLNLSEEYDVESAAFKKRIRFTGRDSAFVFVF